MRAFVSQPRLVLSWRRAVPGASGSRDSCARARRGARLGPRNQWPPGAGRRGRDARGNRRATRGPRAFSHSSARIEIEPTGSATRRSASGLAEAVGGLLVGAGFVELARTWRRDRRVAMATATAALILGFVVETTPHLVHHVLDPDKGNGCQVLQAAERSHATVGRSTPRRRRSVRSWPTSRRRSSLRRSPRPRPAGAPLPPSRFLLRVVPRSHRLGRGVSPRPRSGLRRGVIHAGAGPRPEADGRHSGPSVVRSRARCARGAARRLAAPGGRLDPARLRPACAAGGGACRAGRDGPPARCEARRRAARGGDPVHRAGRAARQLARGAGRARHAGEPGRRRRRSRRSLALPGRARPAASRRVHRVLARPVCRRRPRHERRPRLRDRARRSGGRGIRFDGPERRESGDRSPVGWSGWAGRCFWALSSAARC